MKSERRVQSLFFEIGAEEMPAHYLWYGDRMGHGTFRKTVDEVFRRLEIPGFKGPGAVRIFATPRRLVVFCDGMEFDLSPIVTPVYGPSLQGAYDGAGKPTPALLGFVKSKNIRLDEVKEFDNKGKRCVGYEEKLVPAGFSRELAQKFVEIYAAALPFPKTMKWDDSGLRFPRPIRSVACFLDAKPVPVKLGRLKSESATWVFRNGERKKISVRNPGDYFAKLKKAGVILDADARKEYIEKRVKALVRKSGGVCDTEATRLDPTLLDEVTYLTEKPVCAAGPFDSLYSNLPREVLIASLSRKQRLFSVMNREGKHRPYFVTVLDGGVAAPKRVVDTTAAILKAKLQDSHFFFEEDAKVYRQGGNSDAAGLGASFKLQNDLQHLVYLKEMGTVFDKERRLQEAASALGASWGISSGETALLEKAARFAKTDLLTQMVGEFPELQGVMGGYYMRAAGEDDAVATAVAEQYLPSYPEGPLPVSRVGSALAVLDKADLVVLCFAAGKKPTSSQDPYALKRAISGILRIAVERRFAVRWRPLVDTLLKAAQKFGLPPPAAPDALTRDLGAFYRERLGYFFEHHRGYHADLVEAVLETDFDSVLLAEEKLKALSGLKGAESFVRAVKVIERTSNILKSAGDGISGEIESGHFREDLEQKLFQVYRAESPTIVKAAESGDYGLATRLYAAAFFDILHLFFEKVLVNAPETEVRRNRLSLLNAVRTLYVGRIADLSKIKPAGGGDLNRDKP